MKYMEMVFPFLHTNAGSDMQRWPSIGPDRQDMYEEKD